MIPDRLRIAVAQLNPVVGDISGNLARARAARSTAAAAGADLVLFTELFLSGYPPEDLVLKPAFLAACDRALQQLAMDTADGGPAILIGAPLMRDGHARNAVALLDGGAVQTERYKVDLPNYGEFDEKRVFAPGPVPGPANFRGVRIGLPICEDIWGNLGICETLAESGAELILVANGSPYQRGKLDLRQQVVVRQVVESGLPILYANQVGGQDELVFDGGSFALNPDRSLAMQLGQFEETVAVTQWQRLEDGWRCVSAPRQAPCGAEEADYLGTMS